ncbi:glutathione S-transferase [Anabrus simplex]|uniref:glutathione S-transferase n=1 Tax=Anabrus simplex TaxID=316456 RepID=UPI0035A386D3
MAPKYKLTYFNGKALGEPIRFLLAYGGLEFEDKRINFKDWDKFKDAAPYKLLPLLEEDGKLAYQSKAICRYLAKKVGLMGKDDWENLEIDSAVESFYDFRKECAAYAFEPDPNLKAKKKEKLLNETVPLYMDKLEELAKKNGGHLAGGRLTWADVYFAGMHESYNLFTHQNLVEGRPNLKSIVDKVYSIPAIKSVVDRRPPVEDW